MADIQNTNIIPELQSPFEQLREIDADGKEWWNSRKLTRVMSYGKYWNFERVIAKAQEWTSQKGYHLGEHFAEITEMAELGNGAVREVTSIRLSRAACMAVAMNADQKKEIGDDNQQGGHADDELHQHGGCITEMSLNNAQRRGDGGSGHHGEQRHRQDGSRHFFRNNPRNSLSYTDFLSK